MKNHSDSKVLDFSGKSIYLGIDDHLKHWNVSIYSKNCFHKAFQQEVSAAKLKAYLDRHFPEADYYSACEAGFKGFTTHRELEAVGIKNIVVNAADVPTKDRERKQKADPRDARKLGKMLRGGSLDAIYVPDKLIEQDRALIRYRCDDLVPKMTRIKNQIKSYLYYHGKKIPEEFQGKKWNKSFKSWLSEVEFDRWTARQTLDDLLEELAFYDQKFRQVNRQMVQLSKEEAYAERVALLRTIPGVGLLIAMLILTELVDMRRFKNVDQLCSFIGLIPNTSSSGEKERVGRQTQRGHQLFRRLWIQAAWRARSVDPALLQTYEELVQRMKPQKAIVRIARKLLARMRYVLQNEEPYQLGIK